MVSPGVMAHVEKRLNSNVYDSVQHHDSVGQRNDNFFLQHDNILYAQNNYNCSAHTAQHIKWLQDQNINVLDWSSRSLDMNTVENMWGLLHKKLQSRRVIFHNREELLTAITDEWQTIPQDYCRNLCVSVPRRLAKVFAGNGALTKY